MQMGSSLNVYFGAEFLGIHSKDGVVLKRFGMGVPRWRFNVVITFLDFNLLSRGGTGNFFLLILKR